MAEILAISTRQKTLQILVHLLYFCTNLVEERNQRKVLPRFGTYLCTYMFHFLSYFSPLYSLSLKRKVDQENVYWVSLVYTFALDILRCCKFMRDFRSIFIVKQKQNELRTHFSVNIKKIRLLYRSWNGCTMKREFPILNYPDNRKCRMQRWLTDSTLCCLSILWTGYPF